MTRGASRSPSPARAARPGRATPPSRSTSSGWTIAERLDLGDLAASRAVSVPVLSNSRTRPRRERLERHHSLTMMPRLGGAARSRRRSRSARPAASGHGVRDHQHGERAHRIAADRPTRAAGDHERDRDEDQRVAVGQRGRTAPSLLRLLDEPNDAGVRAPVGVATARRSNAAPALTAPERTCSPSLRSTGRDSPVKRGLVEHADARDQQAVHRHHLAVLD